MQSDRLSFLTRLSLVPALATALFAFAVGSLPACGSGEGADGTGDTTGALDDDGVVDDAADGGAKTTLSWVKIYDEAFAPGTPGHCGNSGCHGTIQAGFLCGSTASSCLAGMKTKGLLSTKAPKTSILGSTTSSPLRWVHATGAMPADNKAAEPKLAADIEAWVKAGAPGILLKKDAGVTSDDETASGDDDDTEN